MNVTWIISDTLRRDHLGAYGNQKIRTPSLDAFATKSVRFDRHYAASFPTMPARADYFTGRWTVEAGGEDADEQWQSFDEARSQIGTVRRWVWVAWLIPVLLLAGIGALGGRHQCSPWPPP